MFERSLRVLPLARSGEGRSGLAFPHLRSSLFELWKDTLPRDIRF
ncbi:hypothetical protein [Thermoactinomyces sp. DSM 45892]|nr:hypothetical protein [Thermoactinomyces sp. DSM 45892]